MITYSHIENVFNRDTITNKLVEGDFRVPEAEYIKDLEWIGTEKVDGTNIRIMWDGKQITFGGKSDNAQLHADLVKRLQDLFSDKVNTFIEKFGETEVVMFGEGYGAGIQKGGCYKQTKDFILFDVNIGGIFLERGNIEGIAEVFGIEVVPIMYQGNLDGAVKMVKEGVKSHWGDFIAEGLVMKPRVELRTRRGDRLILKVKTRDFEVSI